MRRAALAIVLLAALVLPGCLQPSPTNPAAGSGPLAGAAQPLFKAAVDVVNGTAEPGVLLNVTGEPWIHAPGSLWRGVDNGTRFQQVHFGTGRVFGGDADLAFGASPKDIYYTDLEDLAGISVFSSHDGGHTWSYQPVASDAPVTDRQWIIAGPDASPLSNGSEAVYLTFNQIGSGVWVTKSTDGGATWSPNLAFATSGSTEADIQTMGNIVVGPNGTIYVAYALGSAGAPATPPATGTYTVAVSVSGDGGLTWMRHDVRVSNTSVANIFPILTVDPSGTVYATWSEADAAGTTHIYLSRSTDHGVTWSAPMRVGTPDGSAVEPWVAAGNEPGELVLAWYQANETAAPGNVTGDWHVELAVTHDAGASAPTFAEASVPGVIHRGQFCSYGILCNGGRGLLDFFEARLDLHDRVHVAYASDLGGNRTVLYRTTSRPLGSGASS